MPLLSEDGFTAPAEIVKIDTLLFDMDGTIIDSTAAIIKHWHQIGEEIDVNGDVILQTSHGRRSIDVLSILKPELATWEYVCRREGQIPKLYGSDAIEVPGSRTLLDALSKANAAWAIVTSGTRPLVDGWLERMQLAHPKVMVTAEDVAKGKPDPACYRLGAERIAEVYKRPMAQSERVMVLEDAPAGIRSGKAAGFRVIGLATTHSIDALREAGADWIVKDARSITLESFDTHTRTAGIMISNALQA